MADVFERLWATLDYSNRAMQEDEGEMTRRFNELWEEVARERVAEIAEHEQKYEKH